MRLVIAPKEMVEHSDTPEPEEPDFIGVDIPSEPIRRLFLPNIGSLLYPHQDMATPPRQGTVRGS